MTKKRKQKPKAKSKWRNFIDRTFTLTLKNMAELIIACLALGVIATLLNALYASFIIALFMLIIIYEVLLNLGIIK